MSERTGPSGLSGRSPDQYSTYSCSRLMPSHVAPPTRVTNGPNHSAVEERPSNKLQVNGPGPAPPPLPLPLPPLAAASPPLGPASATSPLLAAPLPLGLPALLPLLPASSLLPPVPLVLAEPVLLPDPTALVPLLLPEPLPVLPLPAPLPLLAPGGGAAVPQAMGPKAKAHAMMADMIATLRVLPMDLHHAATRIRLQEIAFSVEQVVDALDPGK